MSNIEVIVPQPTVVQVINDVTTTSVTQRDGSIISIENGVTNQNLWVGQFTQQQMDTLISGPGLIIQTGLGIDGTGFTFWIDDGL